MVACSSSGGAADAPDVADAANEASVDGAADALVVSRGQRLLGVAVDLDDLQLPQRLDVARDAGAQATEVTFGWDEIERPYDAGDPDSGDPDAGDPDAAPPPTTVLFNPGLHVVNLVLADRRVEAVLSLEAVGLEGSRAPSELANAALDDPSFEARYDKLLDYVFSQIGDTKVSALLVASSVDAWLAADSRRAASLAAFVTHAGAHARMLRPGLKVGFAVDAQTSAARSADLAPAWSSSDFVAFDYVAGAGGGAAGGASAETDVAQMVAAAGPTRPVLVRQAAFPSSAAAGGSPDLQAAFVREVFQAWDRRPAQMFGLVFRALDDASPAQAAATAARAKRSDPGFLALLGSLGMHDVEFREKPAFTALRREARARGW